ncbi:caspase recruitment domain-containing protein 9 isoform X10 [Oryctolagus cuniculus]|uniref:caspase recruitment domain-containing protein 9 isoform X10 n=1 Tax=Oryctolagus cuniculus TaxID=9986 RepID=UPI00387A508B
MSDYENEDECWSALEGFRVQLTSAIDPARITPYLRQCKVLNPDDEEQVLSDPSLVIRKRKVGVLLDILQRTGHKGYVAFLESLELYYPQLYRKVTGREPARVFSTIIDASGESGLTQLLMGELMKLQKKAQELAALLSAQEACIRELRLRDSLLSTHQERLQRLRQECEAGARELKRCKDENYELAMRLARLSEEKGAALTRARDLQLEVDGLRHSLLRAEEDCTVERKHTLRLRRAMEQRPSQELLWELQQQKAQLEARVQDLEAAAQQGTRERSSPYVQVLEEEWRQVLRDHQEQAGTVFSLRKELRQAEALRARVGGGALGAGRPPRGALSGRPHSARRRRRCWTCSARPCARTPGSTRSAWRPCCSRWRRWPWSGTRPSPRGGSCTPSTRAACRRRTPCASSCGSCGRERTSCRCSCCSARAACWPPRAGSRGSSRTRSP